MPDPNEDIASVEWALERLFRLSMGRKELSRQAAAVGVVVSRAGYAILRSLNEHGTQPLGALARECTMDPAAAVRQMKILEDHGFVERSEAFGDGRLRNVSLTERGQVVYERIVTVRTEYMLEVLSGWTPAERSTLARLVSRLVDDLVSVPFEAPLTDRPQVASTTSTNLQSPISKPILDPNLTK